MKNPSHACGKDFFSHAAKKAIMTVELNCINGIISHGAHSDHGARFHLLSVIAVR
jgi:hypothetical protein